MKRAGHVARAGLLEHGLAALEVGVAHARDELRLLRRAEAGDVGLVEIRFRVAINLVQPTLIVRVIVDERFVRLLIGHGAESPICFSAMTMAVRWYRDR